MTEQTKPPPERLPSEDTLGPLPPEALGGAKRWALRRWAPWAAPLSLIGVIAGLYLLAWERLPPVIRVAAAYRGGEYYAFAEALRAPLERRTGSRVEILETKGSAENHALLAAGLADLAVLQLGSVELQGVTVITPLFHDVVQVVVREGSGIGSIDALRDRRVSIGPPGSGMRASALEVLAHYGIDADGEKGSSVFFTAMKEQQVDAAIVTTGLLNADLNRLLRSGEYRLLPIAAAEAIALRSAYFTPVVVPRALHGTHPPVPPEPVRTIATHAVLSARENVAPALVTATLGALYDDNLRLERPDLMPVAEVKAWTDVRLHEATRSFLYPNEQLRVVGGVIHYLVNTKELLAAIGAGIYGLWLWLWRRRRARLRKERNVAIQKHRLDFLLKETLRIERGQLATEDPSKLHGYLQDVTRIKLRAVYDLTDERLRGDRLLSIFLLQCFHLSQKIQGRLGLARSRRQP